MATLWRVVFLTEHYGRMTPALDEVAEQIGLAPSTIKNRRLHGDFARPRADGRALYADVQDVAEYLERRRQSP